MIIINNKNVLNKVYVPKTVKPEFRDVRMNCKGETDNKEYVLYLIDEEDNEDYFCLIMDVSELPDQEYKYTLYEDNKYNVFLSTGLMRIGTCQNKINKEKYTEDLL